MDENGREMILISRESGGTDLTYEPPAIPCAGRDTVERNYGMLHVCCMSRENFSAHSEDRQRLPRLWWAFFLGFLFVFSSFFWLTPLLVDKGCSLPSHLDAISI